MPEVTNPIVMICNGSTMYNVNTLIDFIVISRISTMYYDVKALID